jgi:hypothetical protein
MSDRCRTCGHCWSLHDGCCRWRDGEDFCLCIADEPWCDDCDLPLSECACDVENPENCDSPYHPGCRKCEVR